MGPQQARLILRAFATVGKVAELALIEIARTENHITTFKVRSNDASSTCIYGFEFVSQFFEAFQHSFVAVDSPSQTVIFPSRQLSRAFKNVVPNKIVQVRMLLCPDRMDIMFSWCSGLESKREILAAVPPDGVRFLPWPTSATIPSNPVICFSPKYIHYLLQLFPESALASIISVSRKPGSTNSLVITNLLPGMDSGATVELIVSQADLNRNGSYFSRSTFHENQVIRIPLNELKSMVTIYMDDGLKDLFTITVQFAPCDSFDAIGPIKPILLIKATTTAPSRPEHTLSGFSAAIWFNGCHLEENQSNNSVVQTIIDGIPLDEILVENDTANPSSSALGDIDSSDEMMFARAAEAAESSTNIEAANFILHTQSNRAVIPPPATVSQESAVRSWDEEIPKTPISSDENNFSNYLDEFFWILMIAPTSGDSVIYQNWLMKRSQVTRMFRRRFAILTASGKLYSFRKADLGKPESIHLTQASLVWDIRGCTVELAPKLGKGTWVLRPTGTNLKEEIYLRVCSFSPNSSTEHWMNILVAVSRNNLRTLFDPDRASFLHVSLTVAQKYDQPFYLESEGSLCRLELGKDSPDPYTYSSKICIRDKHPGSCLIICQYASDYAAGERPCRKSCLIPRYMFYKSKTSLPWTTLRPLHIEMSHDSGDMAASLVMTLRLQIDEHLRAYVAPLFSRYIDDEDPTNLDFSLFKFQIKRLIRLIDKLGDIRQNVIDVFEWKNMRRSAIWMVYLTISLLVFPRVIPTLILCHALYYSLLNSVEFRSWLGNLSIGGSIAFPQQVPQPAGTASPVTMIEDSVDSTTNLSPKTRVKAAVRDAAKVAIQQVQSVMGKQSLSSDILRPEIWENQRRVFGGAQFSASNLSVFDRSRWSNIDGTIALEPPSSTEWRIDIDAPNSDDNGWTYNVRWGASDWHPSYSTWDLVRRRRWVPTARGNPAPTRANDNNNKEHSQSSGPIVQEAMVEATNVASLSGVVTSGPEYGNIPGDYDESNAEHQPKQSGLGSMFSEFKQTANVAQLEIGRICADIEKYMNLFSWRDELISTVASAGLAALIIASMFVPINVIVYVILFGQFTLGYRRRKWRQIGVQNVLRQHVLPALPEGTLEGLGGVDAHKLCLTLSKRTGIAVTQKVIAGMESPEMLAMWMCKQNKALVSLRTWMKRDLVENYLDHVPPEVSEEDQSFFPDFTQPTRQGLVVAKSPGLDHSPGAASVSAPEDMSDE